MWYLLRSERFYWRMVRKRPVLDRDREGARGLSLPTPPCVRVRTRRFDGLERTCAGARDTNPSSVQGVRLGSGHASFGPFRMSNPGFTRSSHLKANSIWMFCRCAFMSTPSYCPRPSFGPSLTLPTTMPSADCAAIRCLTQSSYNGYSTDLPG